MASPDALRLYFGRRAPPEVLDIIFECGFNLWLGQRYDIMRYQPYYDDEKEVWSRVVYHTTALLVREEQLCAYALKLVWANYRKAVSAFVATPAGGWDLARPFVIDHDPDHPVEWSYSAYELDYGTLPKGWMLSWVELV
jgi:hypothetical protein